MELGLVAWPHRVALFGIRLDAVSMAEAVALLLEWSRDNDGRCRYVVTPNVDHVVILQRHAGMRSAYRQASLVVADGWPIVTASRWLGRALPERVAGSDLVPALFDAYCERGSSHDAAAAPQVGRRGSPPADDRNRRIALTTDDAHGLRVYLLGAAPGVAEQAAANIHARWPAVQVVGYESPPLGFEHDVEQNHGILARIANVEPDLLIVGLGAPKQELWIHKHAAHAHAKVAICAGATIDFLAGKVHRAPLWMRRARLEWLHRLLSEPRRLASRYLRDAIVFPQLVLREMFGSRRSDDLL
jgi:N-acetylglucosaminyldiphosphoundecaprenol N-acetyl-beta-D-mannosaminyltransferase